MGVQTVILGLIVATFFLSQIPATPVSASICENWIVGTTWAEGYEAHLVFTSDHHVSVWEVNLRFDKKVDSLECWVAKVETKDNIHFKLTREHPHGDVEVGDTVDILLHVFFDNSDELPDMVEADMDGQNICGTDVPTTTSTSTEKTTTTEKTTSTTELSTTSPVPGADCSNVFTVEDEEDGKWHGLISVAVVEDTSGWEVSLQFDQTVDSLQTPLGESSGAGKHWVIDNKSFDGNLNAGDIFELKFEVYFSGRSPDILSINFNNMELCDGEVITTTAPPGGDCSETVTIETEEDGKWHGLIAITPSVNTEGWELQLRFTHNLDSLRTPLGTVTGSGNSWVVTSKSFDEDLTAGVTLEFRFEVFYSGNMPVANSVVFNEQSLCQ